MNRDHDQSAFTLIELLVVIAIFSVVAGTSLITYDFFGTGSSQEFRRILSFLRLQHARTLQSGSTATLHVNAKKDLIELTRGKRTLDRLTLDRWNLVKPQRVTTVRLSPWSFQPERLTFTNGPGQKRVVRTDWTLGFVEMKQ